MVRNHKHCYRWNLLMVCLLAGESTAIARAERVPDAGGIDARLSHRDASLAEVAGEILPESPARSNVDCNLNGVDDYLDLLAQNCCMVGQGPGCSDPAIEACVCAFNPFCCTDQWD